MANTGTIGLAEFLASKFPGSVLTQWDSPDSGTYDFEIRFSQGTGASDEIVRGWLEEFFLRDNPISEVDRFLTGLVEWKGISYILSITNEGCRGLIRGTLEVL